MIKNFTPHPISICNNAGEIIRVIQPEGLVRLKAVTVPAGEIDGVPLTRTKFGEPEGLPKQIFSAVSSDGCWGFYGETSEDAIQEYMAYMQEEPAWVGIETYYIVSQIVKSALPTRKDLLVPAEVVRDENGNIVGCKSLGL